MRADASPFPKTPQALRQQEVEPLRAAMAEALLQAAAAIEQVSGQLQ
jgi:hypothetical protein